MKKITLLSMLIGIMIWSSSNIIAQCEPDTVNCIDLLDPGQICPMSLPDGEEGQAYNQIVTIIPPYETVFGDGILPLVKIVVDEISNLPPGITYESNADVFYVDTAYCVLLSGTPTTAGTYNIGIVVTPYVLFLENPYEAPQQTDDTSLTIIIHPATTIKTIQKSDVSLIHTSPNPFIGKTNIAFEAFTSGEVEITVYNYIGNEVLNKVISCKKGSNHFEIDGSSFNEGFYFLQLKKNKKTYLHKLVKLD